MIGLHLGGGVKDNISVQTLRKLRDSHFSAFLALELTPRVVEVVDFETGFIEEFGCGDDLVHKEVILVFVTGLGLEKVGDEVDLHGTGLGFIIRNFTLSRDEVKELGILITLWVEGLRGVLGYHLLVDTLMV